MTSRGFSRGAPKTLTKSEQEHFVKILEEDTTLRDAISTITGCEFDSLTFGEKLIAFDHFQEAGRALQVVAAAGRARRDVEAVAKDIRDEASLSVQVAELNRKIEEKDRELLAAREAKADAEDRLREQKAASVSKRAESARAVNSGEKVSA